MSYYRTFMKHLEEKKKQYTSDLQEEEYKGEFVDGPSYGPEMEENKHRGFRIPHKTKTVRTMTNLMPTRIRVLNQYQKSKGKRIHIQQQVSEAKQNYTRNLYSKSIMNSQQISRVESRVPTSSQKYEELLTANNQNLQEMNMKIMDRLLSIVQQSQQASQVKHHFPENRSKENQDKNIVINNIVPCRSNQKPLVMEQELLKKEIELSLLEKQRKFAMTTPISKLSNRKQHKINHETGPIILSEDCQINHHQKHSKPNQSIESSIINIDHFFMDTYRSKQEKKQDMPNTKGQQENSATIDLCQEEKKEKKEQISHQSADLDENQQITIKKEGKTEQIIIKDQSIQESEKKQQIFLQIPVKQKVQSISLAEAFAQRIGKLSSQSREKPIKSASKPKVREREFQKHQKPRNKQNITINTNPPETNRVQNPDTPYNNLQTPQNKEPSEQLMNRLIYGTKAQMSKKQMYALTKKNYEKLPEIMEKKKQEQKKQLQFQRLMRIKEYQKSIRASKSSLVSQS